MRFTKLFCVGLLGWVSPCVVYAQPILYNFNGASANDQFGYSVSGAGDVNGDGYMDLIVGPGTTKPVQVFSGVDGNLLYSFDNSSSTFGSSVSSAGDVNGDGYSDLVIGAFYSDAVRVRDGATGNLLYETKITSFQTKPLYGWSVSSAGDVNGDGYDDVVIGAPEHSAYYQLYYHGLAQVRSGRDWSILYNFYGDNHHHYLGQSVSGAGDVNGDGYADVIAGSAQDDRNGTDAGLARVYSGVDGTILYTFTGDNAGDRFGQSVSDAGDVNKDGYADFIVGAVYDDNNGTDSGSARVYSGADGSIFYTFNGDNAGDQFGISVSGAGDVNHDGYADMIVGAQADDNNGSSSGSARVFSGVDGSILYTFDGDSASDGFGRSVSGAGDVNKDGYGDVIVGASGDDNNGSGSGLARVFSGKGLWTDSDGDGLNDADDSDDDNDGVLDINDLMPVLFIDTDSDGISDFLDWDDDNDGVPDTVDAAPLNAGDVSEITLPLDGNYKGLQLKGTQNAIH